MTTAAPRCDNCDKPIATQTDYYSLGKDEGGDLCWRLFNGGGRGGVCNQPSVDWCARTRAAEARAVTPETVIAIVEAIDEIDTDEAMEIAGRHVEDVDDAIDLPGRHAARDIMLHYIGPGADAIKHDLARLVMERAGLK